MKGVGVWDSRIDNCCLLFPLTQKPVLGPTPVIAD